MSYLSLLHIKKHVYSLIYTYDSMIYSVCTVYTYIKNPRLHSPMAMFSASPPSPSRTPTRAVRTVRVMQRCSFLRRCSSHQSWMPSRGHLGYYPPQSLTWNLKNDGFPSSESPIPFGAIFRWTMLNLGRVCWYGRNLTVFFRWRRGYQLSYHWKSGLVGIKVAANMGGGFTYSLFSPGSLGK